jgi:hypothetical protein
MMIETTQPRRILHWCRALLWHLPEQPYPSDHPWAKRRDPQRPRG